MSCAVVKVWLHLSLRQDTCRLLWFTARSRLRVRLASTFARFIASQLLAQLSVHLLFIAMAVSTPAEMKALLASKVDYDLLFLWSECEVDVEHQVALAKVRITNIGRFAAIEESREPFKKLMMETCGLEAGTIETNAVISDFVTA